MKKNDWILISAVIAYSILFYKQTAGINFVLFNTILISLLYAKDKNILKQSSWRWVAIGSLASAICIGWYGNMLSVIANVISLSILAGMSVNANSSLILSLLFSFYSYFSSPVFMYMNWEERNQKTNVSDSTNSSKKMWMILIPVFITLLFFFMYRASNPLFNDLAKNINFDFISWNWITFTLGGIIIVYGFFYHQQIKYLAELEEQATINLKSQDTSSFNLWGKNFTLEDELFSGKIMFILLNSLLLIVNILDINFLFLGGKLPEGISYSEYVHQGVGMLITSIIIAVVIILFYFRGALNFYEKNKGLKILSYTWIIQNVFVLISTAIRNNMYVNEYSLTYKRIGVYIYLLLALIGLLTVLIKVMNAKSNHYLFRTNGWLFFSVLISSCFFNWDLIITEFNINNSKNLEKNYLLELSDTNLAHLVRLEHNADKPISNQLSRRLYWFLYNHQTQDFRSWYYDITRVYNEIVYLNSYQEIRALNLRYSGIKTLKPLERLSQISEIDLSFNKFYDLKELKPFSNLKKLNMSDNKLMSLNGIEELRNLEYLNIVNNRINNYYPLCHLMKLKELYVSNSISNSQLRLLKTKLPTTLIFKQ